MSESKHRSRAGAAYRPRRTHHDVEASYRRMQLYSTALEDYFALRGAWFSGPKASFAWLRANDSSAYRAFARAAEAGAGDSDFADLVAAAYGPFEAELTAP